MTRGIARESIHGNRVATRAWCDCPRPPPRRCRPACRPTSPRRSRSAYRTPPPRARTSPSAGRTPCPASPPRASRRPQAERGAVDARVQGRIVARTVGEVLLAMLGPTVVFGLFALLAVKFGAESRPYFDERPVVDARPIETSRGPESVPAAAWKNRAEEADVNVA